MKKIVFSLTAMLFLFGARAQQESHEHQGHQGHHMHDMTPEHKSDTARRAADTLPPGHTGSGEKMAPMSHAFSLNLPMTRNGSGTAWLPDAAPMYGAMYHSRSWMFMLHGNLFVRYNNQDFTRQGSRGGSKVDAPGWLMFMGQRRVARKGLLHFNAMLSPDAVFGGAGYPLLFQSGEAYRGQPLVDRQHPHDLFSELSVSYSYAFSKKLDVFVYLGYPGEPALGPVAFMHRPSALFNPDAPISHHWLDATHITFGVATLGVRYGRFKLEASSFTGREPDEHRYNFDRPRFDSRSFRLSFNPTPNLALQASHAYIKNPEQLHAGDVHRTTVSALYSLRLPQEGRINALLAWGLNKEKDHKGEYALIGEGSWNRGRTAVYGRYELVQKSVEELSLEEALYGHDALFAVHAVTLGGNYRFLELGKASFAAGGQWSIYAADSRLHSLYGKSPMAFQVYLRIYPGLMRL